MKRHMRFFLSLAFALACASLLAFLHQFTIVDANWIYLENERSVIVSEKGTETAFDPMEGEPSLKDGEFFRFTLTLPHHLETESNLVFDIKDAETKVFLNGKTIYSSTSSYQSSTASPIQVQIPLTAGNGDELVMEIRPLSSPMGIFPPLPRMSADPTDARGNIAYGNYYSLPAGAAALALALIWGLFLFSVLNSRTDWRLLLLVLTCTGLTIHPIAVGYGWYFFTEPYLSIFCWRGIPILSALALLIYLLLHREKKFRSALLYLTTWSAGVLTVCLAVSAMQNGYLFNYLKSQLTGLIQTGYYDGLLYWLTAWLIFVCTLLSIWDIVRSVIQMNTEARTLRLKNEMATESYRTLEEKMRESAAVRHEFSHQLTALSAMYDSGNFDGIGRFLAEMRGRNQQSAQMQFTQHFAVNIMLQSASERADKAGIHFEASALLPEVLPIPDEDLCTLIMNMLDNALEGAEQAEKENRFIHIHIHICNGFLAIFSENGYSCSLSTDQNGKLRSTKPNPETHGFGMALMENIAEKYNSLLNVNYTENVFTVQTALRLPKETKV